MKMKSLAVHPVLIAFALGPLAVSVVFDSMDLLARGAGWSRLAFVNLGVGLVAGSVVVSAACAESLGSPSATRAGKIRLARASAGAVAFLLFGASFAARSLSPERAPGGVTVLLSILGLGVALIAAWLAMVAAPGVRA